MHIGVRIKTSEVQSIVKRLEAEGYVVIPSDPKRPETYDIFKPYGRIGWVCSAAPSIFEDPTKTDKIIETLKKYDEDYILVYVCKEDK